MIVDPFGRLYDEDKIIVVTKRVTSSFLKSIPKTVNFGAYIYAVVKRKPEFEVLDHKWGVDVRLDPCLFNWEQKTITIYIPLMINYGIDNINNLHPNFYEGIEAAFLAIFKGCYP